jgi:hypothetical protein
LGLTLSVIWELINVLHIIIGFDREDGMGMKLTLINATNNRTPIDALLMKECRIGAARIVGARCTEGLSAAGLALIGIELRLRQSGRHPRIKPVRDCLEIETLLVVDREPQIEVEGLRVVITVFDKSILRRIAGKQGYIKVLELLTYGEGLLKEAVRPPGQEGLKAIDIAAPPRSEMDHAAERVIVVQGGRGSADDLSAPHEPGIVDIKPR